MTKKPEDLAGVYRECVSHYRSGSKRGKCRRYHPVVGAKKRPRKAQKRFCISWRKTKPKRCKEFGTRAEAKRLGLL